MLKVKLTSNEILDKRFTASTAGYDAVDVDTFIDEIIKDYLLIEKNLIISEHEFKELNKKIDSLNKEKTSLEIENSKLKKRFSNIKEEDNVTTSNIELLRKLHLYEKALWDAGIDPTKIK